MVLSSVNLTGKWEKACQVKATVNKIEFIGKAPISLNCDCFATAGDRHREWVAKQSQTVASDSKCPRMCRQVAQSSRENFEHVQKFNATKFLAKWSQSHRGCLETVANLSLTPRNLVAIILEHDIFAR